MNSELPSDSPKLDRTIAILFGVLIVTLALLFVIAGMTWAVRNELVGGPTATPTATQKATIPPTPDFRATRFIQDALTRAAYETVVGPVTPEVVRTRPPDMALLPIVSMPGGEPGAGPGEAPPLTETPSPVPTPTPTPVTVGIHLPVVSNPDQTPTAGAPISVVETPASTHTPAVTDTPTPPPPTFTPTLEPTVTPLPVGPTPTETPILPVQQELRARVTSNNGATVRVGPSTIYSDTGQIENGTEIQLWGRTASGEWVYGCCIIGDEGDEESFWVRQADAPPIGNDFGDAVPTGETSDDVRWLRIQPLDPTLTPMPSPTAITATDYPLYRRDPANQARVAQLPRPQVTLIPGWPYLPGGNFLSPVVVGGNNALATSTDSHIYSVDRQGGNQRWREQLEGVAQQAAAIVGEHIYLVDVNGLLYDSALQSGDLRWREDLKAKPVSGVNVADKYLFISVQRDTAGYWLLMRKQEDGKSAGEFSATGILLQYPAIGDQLVYVAGEHVWALDIFDSLAEVWKYEGINNATAPPLYIRPGARAAAELYVADNKRVISLDANTGILLWVYESDDQVTGMAADGEHLYLSGNGFIKAISRRDSEDRWRELTDGLVLGGPIVGDGEVLIMTENGDITYRDAEDGGQIFNFNVNDRLVSSGAVSGERIFIAGSRGMYGFQGGGQ